MNVSELVNPSALGGFLIRFGFCGCCSPSLGTVGSELAM